MTAAALVAKTGIGFGDETLSVYDEGTFTATGTGFASVTTVTATYVRVGKMVTISFPVITGTSNSTSFTVTGIPAAFYPLSILTPVLHGTDNGTLGIRLGSISSTTGVVTLYSSGLGQPWTNSGTKELSGFSISYPIA